MMNGNLSPELDELDLRIIKEMETDGRQSISQLARRLNVARKVAARRLQRLLDERIIRVVALAAAPALGYQVQILTGIKVQPGRVNEVAAHLQTLPSIHLVAILAGRNDVLIWALFRNSTELSAFLLEELGNVPGIIGTETWVGMKLRKASFTYLTAYDDFYRKVNEGLMGRESYPQLDDIDLKIIAEAERDGRQSVSDLASKLGLSRPTVHAKLQRLLEERVLKVIALCRPRVLGFETMAVIGLKVCPAGIDAVANALVVYPNIHMVFVSAGSYDIFIMTLFRDSAELYEFLRHDLGSRLNVTSAEIMIMLDVRKHSLSFLAHADANG